MFGMNVIDHSEGRVRHLAHRASIARSLLACTFAATLAFPAPTIAQEQVVACENCHGDREFLVGKGGSEPREEELYVPRVRLAESSHAGLACVACHPGFGEGYPHRADEVAISCEACHPGPGAAWEASSHAANVQTRGDAATCVSCHGYHTVLGTEERSSPTHPLNVASLCGGCHADPAIIGTYFMAPDEVGREAVSRFYETVHGSALTRAGLVVSATCNDCHRAQEVLPAEDPESSVNRTNIAETCGSCHEGVLEEYMASSHGEAHRAGVRSESGEPAPVCVECHSAHGIVRADEPRWFIGVVEECGSCHERLYETYFETYHGKVTSLGYNLTAKCSDCHTAHSMRPPDDPESSVYPANLMGTCGGCHEGANANFVKYYSHGDPKNRTRFPRLFWPYVFMTSLLVGVFAFFGTHTFLWLSRLGIDRIKKKL